MNARTAATATGRTAWDTLPSSHGEELGASGWRGLLVHVHDNRFSTDGRTDRQTPTLAITWRETNGQSPGSNDRVRLRIRWNSVISYANGGVDRGGGTTPSYTWGDKCYDTHQDGTWEQCRTTFNIGDFEVHDIRVFIATRPTVEFNWMRSLLTLETER